MRYYEFQSVELVHIDRGPAAIVSIAPQTLIYTDDIGRRAEIDFQECARVYWCLKQAKLFPPAGDLDWGPMLDVAPIFPDLPLTSQAVVGLRGAIDDPPWFQFLNRRRTQFEFRDYDHIKSALLNPLAANTRWYSWDAS